MGHAQKDEEILPREMIKNNVRMIGNPQGFYRKDSNIWFFDVLLIPQHDPEKVLEDYLLDIYRYVSSENEKQWVSMMSEFWCLGRDV